MLPGSHPCLAPCLLCPTLQGTLLVLDEPTNHLDIPSKETLEEAVSTFEGEAAAAGAGRMRRCLVQAWPAVGQYVHRG